MNECQFCNNYVFCNAVIHCVIDNRRLDIQAALCWDCQVVGGMILHGSYEDIRGKIGALIAGIQNYRHNSLVIWAYEDDGIESSQLSDGYKTQFGIMFRDFSHPVPGLDNNGYGDITHPNPMRYRRASMTHALKQLVEWSRRDASMYSLRRYLDGVFNEAPSYAYSVPGLSMLINELGLNYKLGSFSELMDIVVYWNQLQLQDKSLLFRMPTVYDLVDSKQQS